jgi:hypothetical protein
MGRLKKMESVEMSILSLLHDGAALTREDMIRKLDKYHHGEVGESVDRFWVGGLLKAKGVDVFCISPDGLKSFNEEMLRGA